MSVFIVTGCPRSGTSLVAGILHTNGIPMGSEFNEHKSRHDPFLRFEDLEFADWNMRVLQWGGGDDLNAPDEEALYRVIAGVALHHHIVNTINARLIAYDNWGFKDPRLVFLWQHYLPCLSIRMNPSLILTHRNPLSIARSLVNCGQTETLDEGLRVAWDHESRLSLVAASVRWPVLHVGFEDWWRHPERNREALNELVGRELDYSHFNESLWRA